MGLNVGLLYLFPIDNREVFTPFAERWVDTYLKYKAGVKHEVYVAMVNADPGPEDEDYALFKKLNPTFLNIYSDGYDIGAMQESIEHIDCDFLCTGTSRHYYRKPDWLKRMVEERKKYGDGLYGAMASLETNSLIPGRFPNPHIRTAFYGFSPVTMRSYPYRITNRERGYLFESGAWNVSEWYADIGLPVRMVTWDNSYPKEQWAQVPGRFRHNNQEAIIVADKHTDLWTEVDSETKREWSRRAWG